MSRQRCMCRPFLWEGSLCSQFRLWLSTVNCPRGFRVGSSSWEMLRPWGLTSWLHPVGLHWHPPCKTYMAYLLALILRGAKTLCHQVECKRNKISVAVHSLLQHWDSRVNVTKLPVKLSLSCEKLVEVGTYPLHLMRHTSFIQPQFAFVNFSRPRQIISRVLS